MIKKVKQEIRIIGWDDAPFTFRRKYTNIIGVICRAGTWIDGVLFNKIRVDGMDVSEKIIESVKSTGHFDQLRVIMLSGITFAGFNIADIERIYNETGMPVIVIIRDMPDMESIKRALARFEDFEERWRLIENAGEVFSVRIKNRIIKKEGVVYYQKCGISNKNVEEIINLTSVHSLTPEPLRLAHIIGSGLKKVRLC